MSLFTPRATITGNTGLVSLSPEPTVLDRHQLARRYETKFGPVRDCGYWGENATYRCGERYHCRFHASNAAFPGMLGCCSNSSDTPCSGFLSVCYGTYQIAQSPSLLSSTDDLAMLCTDKDFPHCLAYTWPDMNISAFLCTNFTRQGTPTLHTMSTYTNASGIGATVVSVLSVSGISDDELITRQNIKSTKKTGQSSTSTAESSSAPLPTLIGAVVGSVVGVAIVIAASIIIFWRALKLSLCASLST
ncbi:hypothetical protein BDV28DRAFT_161123 [Aspergillus coremiiformis]|uniref:Uncharacterized protein n=1 Tax=Aspergillus coremiiformis TaxID=138285 RepID=A0A5N6YT75_9EURO|nr:hypothetical protein BDV28DRAFT_161123 [Aspergillus coremiiformis]